MIVSHRHRFIFLKTSKTAGTSVEIALSQVCGPDDIITPIAPEDEAYRRGLGYRGPQHYLAPWPDYRPIDVGRLLLRRQRKLRFYNHISATNVRSQLPAEVWDNYFKFCFERNPWDRFLSFYYWQYRRGPQPSFAEVLDSPAVDLLKLRGWQVYTINGEVAVNRICRYENVEQELDEVCKKLGISQPLTLPHAKANTRRDRRSYREVLGDAERRRIEQLFADEIKALGYTF
jgi:hypothetical protein